MAGVSFNTSEITESTKTGYVTYDIYTWQQTGGGYCAVVNPDPPFDCLEYVDPTYGWVYSSSGSTGAKIVGDVVSSSSVYVNGNPIAYIGSTTNETWVADPPIPPDDSTTEYRNISPGTSGSENGSITGGSSSVYVGGQSISMIGSQVTTGLGNTTAIQTGSSDVFAS